MGTVIINTLLRDESDLQQYLPLSDEPHALQESVRSGVLLSRLLQRWVPMCQFTGRINPKPKNKFDMLENHTLMLQAASRVHCKISSTLSAADLIEGQPHLILAVVWQILHAGLHLQLDHLAVTLGVSKKNFLTVTQHVIHILNTILQRCKVERTIHNLSTDIMDSSVYFYLLHYLAPSCCSLEGLKERDVDNRAEMVLEQVRGLGLMDFMSAKSIVEGNTKLNFLFTSLLLIQLTSDGKSVFPAHPQGKVPHYAALSRSGSLSFRGSVPSGLHLMNSRLRRQVSDPTEEPRAQNLQSSKLTSSSTLSHDDLAAWEKRLRELEEKLSSREQAIKRKEDALATQQPPGSPLSLDEDSGTDSGNDSYDTLPVPSMAALRRSSSSPQVLALTPEAKRLSANFCAADPDLPDLDGIEASCKQERVSRPPPSIHLLSATTVPSTLNHKASSESDLEHSPRGEKKDSRARSVTDGNPPKKKKKRRKSAAEASSPPVPEREHHDNSRRFRTHKLRKAKRMLTPTDAHVSVEELKGIMELVEQMQKQNSLLKEELFSLREQVECVVPVGDTTTHAWSVTRLRTEEILAQEDLSLKESVECCWLLVDECERLSCQLQSTQEHLNEEHRKRANARKETELYLDSIQDLKQELTDLHEKEETHKIVIGQLMEDRTRRSRDRTHFLNLRPSSTRNPHHLKPLKM